MIIYGPGLENNHFSKLLKPFYLLQIGRLIYEMSGYGTDYYPSPVVSVHGFYGGYDEGNSLRVATKDYVTNSTASQQLSFRKGDILEFMGMDYKVPVSEVKNVRTGETGDISVFDLKYDLTSVNFQLLSDF